MANNRADARLQRHHRVAERYAAIAMVGAFEMLGHSRTAAIDMTAKRLEVGQRSISAWLGWAGPELPSGYALVCLGATYEDLK